MHYYELFLAFVSLVVIVLCLLIAVLFGWYIVWVLVLSQFRFVRELMGGVSESPTTELRKGRIQVQKLHKN